MDDNLLPRTKLKRGRISARRPPGICPRPSGRPGFCTTPPLTSPLEGSHDLGDDFLEFDHRTIAKVEAGRLWLEGFERGTRRAYGPILVPAAATKLLCKGWDLSCALGRVDGTWRIVEVANVYPV